MKKSGAIILVGLICCGQTADKRRTIEQYAADRQLTVSQAQGRFRSTGRLTCGASIRAPAQLVGKRDVLISPGSPFFAADCTRKSLDSCTFSLDDGTTSKPIAIDTSTLVLGQCGVAGAAGDWATVRLLQPVGGDVLPYAISSQLEPPVPKKGQAVLQLSYSFDSKQFGSSKIVEDCFVRNRVGLPTSISIPAMRTDCSGGAGSYGAAQFIVDSSGMTIIGAINVGNDAQLPVKEEFSAGTAFPLSIELRGEFLRAVRDNLNGSEAAGK